MNDETGMIKRTYNEIVPQIKKEVTSLKNRFNAASWKAKAAIGLAVGAFTYASFGFAPDGVGASTMFAMDAFQSNWDYLNLAAMMLATASNVMPSGDKYDLSHYSRFLISKAAALNVIYQVAHGRNIPALIFEGLSVINKYDVMNEKDVPNIDKSGKKLSTIKKWSNYFASGLNKNKLLKQGMKIEHLDV